MLEGNIEKKDLPYYALAIKKLSNGAKKEVLKIDSKITPQILSRIIEIKDSEKIEEAIHEIQRQHKRIEDNISYIIEIAKGEKTPEIKIIDRIHRRLEVFQSISFDVFNRINAKSIRNLPHDIKNECINIMQKIVKHINRELEELGKIIIIKKEISESI